MKIRNTKTVELLVTPGELRELADRIEKKAKGYPSWAVAMLNPWKINIGGHEDMVVYIRPDLLAMQLEELELRPPREPRESER